jgi:hypothetical protein
MSFVRRPAVSIITVDLVEDDEVLMFWRDSRMITV